MQECFYDVLLKTIPAGLGGLPRSSLAVPEQALEAEFLSLFTWHERP